MFLGLLLSLISFASRPNVGKSNLFNRICGRNKALVSNVAGTTRDLLYGSFEWMGETIDVVDTGGMFQVLEQRCLRSTKN